MSIKCTNEDKLITNQTTKIQYLGPAVREQHAVFSRGDFAVVTLPVVEFVTGVVIVHIHIEAEGLTLLFKKKKVRCLNNLRSEIIVEIVS